MPLVDHVGRHRCLHDALAALADPLAADMALDGEHARLVVQLLGHVLADALHGLAATTARIRRLVRHVATRQVGGKRRALGRLLLVLVLLVGLLAMALQLAVELVDVGVQRLLQQASLLGREGAGEALAGGGELHPLEDRHLVRELVDERLLEGELVVTLLDLGEQRLHGLPHLRVQGVQLLRTDHGQPSCRSVELSASAHPAIARARALLFKSCG